MNQATTEQTFLAHLSEHRKILYKLAFIHCRHPDDRKDLVQEMLVQAWRSFASFDGRVKFSTWLYRVAANTAISFYRRERQHEPDLLSMEEIDRELASAEQFFSEDNATMQTLRLLLNQLDELHGTLLMLYLDGVSHEDIGLTLGISTSNVGTKINRIKQRLKTALA